MLDFIFNVIYSLISGFSEFFPVSASAHQYLFCYLTGNSQPNAVTKLAIHAGCLIALIVCCQNRVKRLLRERKLSKRARRRIGRQADPVALMELRLLACAFIPVFLSIILSIWLGNWLDNMALLGLFLLINGIILFIPRLVKQGNKDGRSLTRLDGVLMGVGGALGVLPGFSRLSGITSVGVSRGGERGYILDLVLLLLLPSTLVLLGVDLYSVLMAQPNFTLMTFLSCIASAAAAFGSSLFSIILIRFIWSKTDGTGFAYYNWGLALFTFILYLTIQ